MPTPLSVVHGIDPHILLTGATGYVGGRLLSRLQEEGQRVRCLVRRRPEFEGRATNRSTFVQGDLLEKDTLKPALQGIDIAYYLVHAMGSGDGFESLDRQAAENFAVAAREAGVKKIIYLGGLGEESEDLSAHLRSRHEVGHILKTSGAQVVEFRASIIFGTGSISFELIRSLVERLPVMVTPRWVRVQAQPIHIDDVLAYLLAAVTLERVDSEVFEIGGADVCTYGDLMSSYARQRGLRRWMIGVPFLSPRLSSLWLGLVTPVYARVGRKLINSIRNPTVVQSDAARVTFPQIQPVGLDEAMSRVLAAEHAAVARTRWCDAYSAGGQPQLHPEPLAGHHYVDHRSVVADLTPEDLFTPIRQIGGKRGWYFASWLWGARGFLDLLFGGVGTRRGRRDPDQLRVGDALDFWRVEKFEANRRLVLRAEMKLPGDAWLAYELETRGGRTQVHQTAIFTPRGQLGRLYWWIAMPIHCWLFSNLLRRIALRAASRQGRDASISAIRWHRS